MQVGTIECVYEGRGQVRCFDPVSRHPLERQHMTGSRWSGRRTLPMAARQADRSNLSNVGLFRYFILANREGASNDWALTRVTRVSGEVKVLFSHWHPST